ncbi:MAG TPA: hypothetical protein VEO20_05975 [Thermoplasmata archaeon]|nr:hypothetical protein [Thermoplasmata archaeon]
MQPPPQPQSWYPLAPQRSSTPQWLILVVVLIIGSFAILPILFGGGFFPGFLSFFLCIPLLFVLVLVLVFAASGQGRRTIPPPPPIQGPMVPAGQQGPVALSCPNCGGPPTNVDRFGVATCSYCGTRFLVR